MLTDTLHTQTLLRSSSIFENTKGSRTLDSGCGLYLSVLRSPHVQNARNESAYVIGTTVNSRGPRKPLALGPADCVCARAQQAVGMIAASPDHDEDSHLATPAQGVLVLILTVLGFVAAAVSYNLTEPSGRDPGHAEPREKTI